MNANPTINRVLGALLLPLALFFSMALHADQDERVTTIPGTDADDTIVVSNSETASSVLASGSGETSTSTSTVVDGQGGNDTLTISNNVLASADVITAILIDPAASRSSATSTGVDGGAGNDEIVSAGLNTTTATTIAAYAADAALDDADISNAEDKVDVSVTTESSATGLDGGDGDDEVISGATIVSDATAGSGGAGSNLLGSFGQSLSIDVSADATANAAGIQMGTGADTVNNGGTITSTADSNSLSLGIGVFSAASSDANATVETAVTANAIASSRSSGIDTDGTTTRSLTTGSGSLPNGGINVSIQSSVTHVSGDDNVTNTGSVTSISTSDANGGSGSISTGTAGSSSATANAQSEAGSAAISSGGGNDIIDNQGVLLSDASADSGALTISFTPGGTDSNGSADAVVESTATATGIAADGNASDSQMTLSTTITPNSITIGRTDEQTAVRGDDILDNSATVTAIADAQSGIIAGSANIDGAGSSNVTSSATSSASALDAGGGTDDVDNIANLNVTSNAAATSLSLVFGRAGPGSNSGDAAVDSSATANANASGISGDSGADIVSTTSLTLGTGGASIASSRLSTAVTGDDTIDSDGVLTVSADAQGIAGGVTIAVDGAANASSNSTAAADAAAINAGGGNDIVTINGQLIVNSDATATGLSVGIGQASTGTASTRVNSETNASANATGVATDSGHDTSDTRSLVIDGSGIRYNQSTQTTAVVGDDTLDNSASVNAMANAQTVGLNVAVSIDGSAQAELKSSVSATAYGLNTGGGSDNLDNSGAVTVQADAGAATINATFTTDGMATTNSGLLGAGTTADSSAVGLSSAGGEHLTSTDIAAAINFDTIGVTGSYVAIVDSISGDADDTVDNSGAVTVISTAETLQGNGAGSSNGTALTLGRTESTAHAGSIESGNGDDDINNSGALSSTADSTAVMVNIGVSAGSGAAIAGNSAWDGGTVATASSVGIDADSGSMTTTLIDVEASSERAQVIYDETTVAASGTDIVTNSGAIDSTATSMATTATATVAIRGIAVGVSTSNAESESSGIRGGEGDDEVENDGDITSTASAEAYTANISFAAQGIAGAVDAVWDSGTSAESTAIGIAGDGGNVTETTRLAIGTDETGFERSNDLADGADTIRNRGSVTAIASSNTLSISAAVVGTGVSVATATSNANAVATAIDAGAGNAVDNVTNEGALTATARANAAAASVSATYTGVAVSADSVWDGGTTATARARGIDVGSGGETITNSGLIISTADATAASVAVAATVKGFAGATATATGTADAIAIDASAGGDADTVDNSGDLVVSSNAGAYGVTAAFTGLGASASIGSVWDGGTEANSMSHGIAVGAGDDVVATSGNVTSTAIAGAADIGISLTAGGIAAAVSTATTNADATAVDAGDGNDTITNRGDLTVTSQSDALSVAVAATGVGIAASLDAAWDGGTTANSSATALRAGAGNDTVTSTAEKTITALSTASTTSADVSITGYGVAAAVTAATSNADARAIDAGDGDDTVTNASSINSTADATADGISVSVVMTGLAGAGGSPLFDNGTTANSHAAGIDGGAGNDTIDNAENTLVVVDVDAETTSTAVAVAFTGVAAAGLDANANAEGVGIDGGDDDDVISNAGDIEGSATATARARTLALGSLAGLAGFDSVAQSDLYGLVGGFGNDSIRNSGTIDLLSEAGATGQSATGSLIGVSISSASAESTANASGLSGGDGDDLVDNSGVVNVDAQSSTTMQRLMVNLAGVSIGTADSRATIVADGISGGSGSDTLNNSGTVRVGPAANATPSDYWMSEIVASGFGAGAVGGVFDTMESTANSTSTGIDGGVGNDSITNSGDVDVLASARSMMTNSTLVLIGAAGSNSESGAVTQATGLDGGDGDDTIASSGSLTVSADALLEQTGGSAQFTLVGSNDASSGLLAATDATGVDGGSGADQIDTSGTITVDALSTLDTGGNGSMSIIGSSSTAGSAGARTAATGIFGGDGNDVINNAATLDIDAQSILTISNSSYTFGGASSSGASLSATTTAEGISGGDGADQIINSGDITIDIVSDLDSSGGSDTTFGGSTSESVSGASATVRGISGGADDDVIDNSGDIRINAFSDIHTDAVSYTFAGGSSTSVVMSGIANAIGMHGDSGDNTVLNRGLLDVTAQAGLVAEGGSKTTISVGNEQSGGHSRATTQAIGLAATDGNDRLETTGILNVRSIAEPETRNNANTSASLVSTTGANSRATSTADSVGLSAGDGDNAMLASGSVTVTSTANAYAIAYANGANLSLQGNATTTVNSTADATATGFEGGAGADTVVNDASVTVTADADTSKEVTITAPVRTFDPTGTDPTVVEQIPYDIDVISNTELPALADGGAIGDGDFVFWTVTSGMSTNPNDPDPRNDGNVGSNGAYYQALRTTSTDANGDEVVTWSWVPAPVNIIDRSQTFTGLASSAAAVGQGLSGSGTSTATGTSTAQAWGVNLGDGDNLIENNGSLTVIADANATMSSSAAGGSTGNATSITSSTATATAYGVLVGAGDNMLVNNGLIDVDAIAIAQAGVDARGGGGVCIRFLWWEWCIAAKTPKETPSSSRSAVAFGVQTGDGNNTIINEAGAEILVSATAANGTVTAVGIRTGSGDDIVINNGLISATNIRGGTTTAGVGIDLGDGNDQLTLGDGSEVVGTVILGNGDDTLTLLGTPTVHDGNGVLYDLPGGDGIDTLILDGEGLYGALLIDFEHAIKTGGGTYRLLSLETLDSLTIDGGALQLDSDYVFSTDGAYITYFDTESAGSLIVNGNTDLNGSVSIERRDDDFMADGTRFSLITASGDITGAFASTTIPEARPLLSYVLEQQANSYDIVANAPSFATVASNPLHAEIADNLYRIAPQTSGDFAEILGDVQQLESGFDRAFAGFSPDSHQALTTSAIAMGLQSVQMLQSHLGNARAVERGKAPVSLAYEPVTLSYLNGQLQASRVQPMFFNEPADAGGAAEWQSGRTWVAGFRADGEYEANDGHSEIDNKAGGFAVGVDYAFGSNGIFGINIAYSDVDVDSLQALANSSIESWTGGVYLTTFSDRSYIEGGLSLTGHDIVNARQLQIGTDVRDITSGHNGDTWMAYLSAGREFGSRAWRLEPYASLYYFSTDEDAYQEFGGGGANQVFNGDSVSSVFGELGARVFRLQETSKGVINWHASLAMAHDFDSQDSDISYAYEGLPAEIFTTRNRNLGSGSVAYELGVAYSRGGSTLSLDYRNQENSDYRNKIISARLALAF